MALLSSSHRSDPASAPGTSSIEPSAARRGLSLLRRSLELPMASYYLVLGAAGLLIGLGILMVLSASSVYAYTETRSQDPYYFVKRQVLFLIIGTVGAAILARMRPSRLRVLGWIGIALAFVLLILTYVPGVGVMINGNQNWLSIGIPGMQLQPSEFAKLAIVVWGADVLARKDKLLDQPRHLVLPYLPVTGMLIMLVVFQGDLGTAIVMCGLVVGVLFIVGVPLRIFAAVLGLGAAMVAVLVTSSANRMKRLVAFLDPNTDVLGTNMQSIMGIYAIASGGWWGRGLGASLQKWGSLQEAHTDFIFAVIAEELGLFGSLVVLVLFLVLGYAGVRIALRSDQPFCRYAAGGVTAWFMLQAVINIAVVLRMIPVMGVPLPLLSYGGSALMANLLALGVLLACARHEPEARALLAARSGRGRRPRVSEVTGITTVARATGSAAGQRRSGR